MLKITPIALPTPWPAVGPVYAYLVNQEPVTLIDVGLNDQPSREALVAGLREAGLEVGAIRRILLTHAHMDHCGQAPWIQEQSGAEIWLHPDEEGKAALPAWWMAGRDRILREAGVPPETQRLINHYWEVSRKLALPLTDYQPLQDGQSFAFTEGGALEAVHLPGHAPGHTGFFERASGTLLGGDHLLEQVTPNPIAEPLPPGHPAGAPHAPHRALTLGQFLGALDRVMALPIKQVFPGHGPVIADHVAVAQGYIAKHERRLNTMHARLGAEGRTVYHLTQEIYPWVKEFNVFLALSEVLAHLDLLVVRGRATVAPGDAGDIYRAI